MAIVMMAALTARAASPGEAVVRGDIDSMKAVPAPKGEPQARRKLPDSIEELAKRVAQAEPADEAAKVSILLNLLPTGGRLTLASD